MPGPWHPPPDPSPPLPEQSGHIERLLKQILANQEKIMTALSDAVAAFDASITSLQTDMNAAFTALQAAVASGNSADVNAAVAALGAANTTLQAMDASAIAAAAAAAPPAPTPPPASATRK
jgi:uncharacterized coiled-coil protein SlyX